jgi:LPXTG-motif cell wall-anchored protein
MSRYRRVISTAVGLGAMMLLSFTPLAAQASADLIDATPARVSIVAPAPGETQSWDMSVRNLTDQSLPLQLHTDGESEALFSGAHPLTIEIQESVSGTIVYAGSVSELLGTHLYLENLPARDDYALVGRVTLPLEAGNEYQEADGRLTFTFATITETAADESLATTGGTLSTGLLVVGGGLLVMGVIAVAMRKKEKS